MASMLRNLPVVGVCRYIHLTIVANFEAPSMRQVEHVLHFCNDQPFFKGLQSDLSHMSLTFVQIISWLLHALHPTFNHIVADIALLSSSTVHWYG